MRSRSVSNRERGFTLTEVMVALLSLVIILLLSAQLLFATRHSSLRQVYLVEARQAARTGADYLHYMLRGTTDMNMRTTGPVNPAAILTWVQLGNAKTPTQTTFDNVTDLDNAAGQLADKGTDILTFSRPVNNTVVSNAKWTGGASAANTYWNFQLGCGSTKDVVNNLNMFKTATGAHADPKNPANLVSRVMLIADGKGYWGTYQITDYQDGSNANCCDTPFIKVINNYGNSGYNPPGGVFGQQGGITNPPEPYLYTGVEWVTVRVRNGVLEQKNGIFDPSTDNPGSAFTPLLPNVEDLQFAYIFSTQADAVHGNKLIWNNTTAAADLMPTNRNVPEMLNPGDQLNPGAYFAANVLSIRITVTSRSSVPLPNDPDMRFRPAAENNLAATTKDAYYHFQASALAVLRNRMLGY